MEYLRGLRVMREDPGWVGKVGVASLLLLSSMVIPMLGQIAFQGWRTLIVRRAAAGLDSPMPRLELDFDYLGKLLSPGFKSFLARLVWVMPVAFLMMGVMMCFYGAMVVTVLGGAAATSHQHGAGGLAGVCCFAFFFLIMIPLMLTAQLPAMVASLRAEISDDLQKAFDFKAVLHMTRGMFKEFFLGQLVLGLLAFPMMLVGILTCGLGMLPAAVVLNIVQGHFMAQIYALWLERGGEPLTLGPLDLVPPAPAGF